MNLFVLFFLILLPELSYYFPPITLILLLMLIIKRDKEKEVHYNTSANEDYYTSYKTEDFIFNKGSGDKEFTSEPVLNIKFSNNDGCKAALESEKMNIHEFTKAKNDENMNIHEITKAAADERIESIINKRFEGCNIDTFLASGCVAEGEVIFDYDGIVTLKDIDNMYFINSDSIDLFK